MESLLNTIRHKAESIELAGIQKAYGENVIIPQLDITFNAGEFNVILGPSGCGKSTTMNMIAGLEDVNAGIIKIGNKEVQTLEPKDRGCAMVFQNYALYPHMTVADNMAYSLKIKGMTKKERMEKVQEVAKIVSLEGYLDRLPSELSGGQRQRVAIGRAIIREPKVMLFDEPLSNLDAKLRHEMRVELSELHNRIGATTIFVTHDQTEAMTLADRILILNKGKVEQFGTPREIYDKPASTFVANFIGAPAMNLIPVQEQDGRWVTTEGTALLQATSNEDSVLGIRPEHIRISSEGRIPVRVKYVEDMGSHKIITAQLAGGEEIVVTTQIGIDFSPAEDLKIDLPDSACHYFNPETTKRR